jgi:hypothetical protein
MGVGYMTVNRWVIFTLIKMGTVNDSARNVLCG